MRALPSALRKQLESAVLAARGAAESSSRAAIGGLGVFADRRPDHLDADQATLRNGLRAKWRQLGADRELLVAECAYEQWHRLLFARFLAENRLLLHPQYKAAVTLADCEELAGELGEPDGWAVAARFAVEILPGIFRLDDPCVRLRLAPEGRHALEQILDGLPSEVFAADDALGWVYQYWQKDKKDEINASERKIGGADIGPVTQLFTENYMVRFLLENSLGAWWAVRHPDSPLVAGFDYLRFDDDGRPAAGSFDGWPDRVAEVSVMDPCCGSGHFLVEAFSLLWQMRVEEEGLPSVDAQDAVLRDNLFGLEIDARCVQIAMFAVLLKAWRAGGGWRELPVPNIACSGISVKVPVEDWKELARGDARLGNALGRLHLLFRDAEILGSLIDPKRAIEIIEPTGVQPSFEDVDWGEVAPMVAEGLSRGPDPGPRVLSAEARSMARAAQMLSRRYSLVTTNVPYLSQIAQGAALKRFCGAMFPASKADLATVFAERCLSLATEGGTSAVVLPQNWLTLSSYRRLRQVWLRQTRFRLLVRLGPGAFSAISGEVVKPILLIQSTEKATGETFVRFVDTQGVAGAAGKDRQLRTADAPTRFLQLGQLENPDARITFEDPHGLPLLSEACASSQGICTGDYPRFGRKFWELPAIEGGWCRQQSTVSGSDAWGGRQHVLFWEGGEGELLRFIQQRLGLGAEGAWIRGTEFLASQGVAITQAGSLGASRFTGDLIDNNVAVVIPVDPEMLPAVWAYCSSPEYAKEVRKVDSKLNVTGGTFLKVPFDVDYWRRVAEEGDPLSGPWSDDQTQWLFEGRPEVSTAPLQVAVARMLGYHWPGQKESDDLDARADADGIVCLPPVAGEAPAADRVHQLLTAAFGDAWSPGTARELLEQAGSKKKNLHDWLRDEFFKQHCALFGNRPFVWHIWDGLRDGFAALVNYHRLERRSLEKLTYTYLGQDWVERQRAEVRDDVAGAEARLAAALALQRKLEAILEGERPYDVYVRWKKLHEQSVGWEPELNNGVRLNIRPFVEADVLRAAPTIHWRKDRGMNPDGSERHNDIHLTLAEKLEARKRAAEA